MAILGPDGKPLSRGTQPKPEVLEALNKINAIAEQGGLPVALQQMAAVFQQDVTSDLVLETACNLLERMHQEQMRAYKALPLDQRRQIEAPVDDEAQIFRALRSASSSPQAYYDVATRFFRLGQAVISRPFYARALELLGKEQSELSQNASVEYAQVMMELGGYKECADILQNLNDMYGGLPVELILKMTECYALLRRLPEADTLYSVITKEATADNPALEEWREETGDLIARVHDFDDRETLGLREWHYVQTRGMLLATNTDANMPGERYAFCAPPLADIARIIAITAAFLDNRGYAPNRLLWLGERSEILARLFAEWWEIDEEEIRPYQAGDNTADEDNLALVVMCHSADLLSLPDEETLFELYEAQAGLIMFSMNVNWTERQPITPDITGMLSQMCYFPWEANVSMDNQGNINITPMEEAPDPRALAKQMAQFFPSDEECEADAQRLAEVYGGCTDLILDHRDGDLFRKSLVTHSPAPSPLLSFG